MNLPSHDEARSSTYRWFGPTASLLPPIGVALQPTEPICAFRIKASEMQSLVLVCGAVTCLVILKKLWGAHPIASTGFVFEQTALPLGNNCPLIVIVCTCNYQ